MVTKSQASSWAETQTNAPSPWLSAPPRHPTPRIRKPIHRFAKSAILLEGYLVFHAVWHRVSRPQLRGGLTSGVSVPRSHRRFRPQARRLNVAGFSFAVIGRGELLLLPFKAMLLSERARRRKSGRPPPLATSFKVQGDIAHNSKNSGFAVAPGLRPQRSPRPKGPAWWSV